MVRIFHRQRRGVIALVVLSLLMGVLAVLHRGVPAAQLDLNDGGVWVTRADKRWVAHLNYPSRTLDGRVAAPSDSFDVGQAGNTVLLNDKTVRKAQNIDAARLTLGQAATVPESVTLLQGGPTAAAVDPKAGKVWTMPADDVASFTAEAKPVLEKAEGARAVVGVDGLVHVVLPDGTVKLVTTDGAVKNDGRIEGLGDLATASLSAVGPTLVVLDAATSAVRTTKGSVHVDAPEKVKLQQPGPDNDRALLAGPDAYLWAPLGGGNAMVLPSGGDAGTPAEPVFLSSCAYLAWAGSGQYVRDCAGDADDQRQSYPTIRDANELVFRVNRDVIVLNDIANGMVLLPNDGMRSVSWQAIENQAKEQENQNNDTAETAADPTAQKRKGPNNKPIAVNDEFGGRPGRTVTLPVLANDSDPDGDVLTASVSKQPSGGAKVSQVRGGEALSIAVPENASGTISFSYEANDGHGGRAEATCTVRVYPASENKEVPKTLSASAMTLGQKGQMSYSVLGDWIDPQGDALYLMSASGASGLDVRSRADGLVTVKDLGTGGVGVKDVTVVVGDGATKAEAKLRVTVKGGDNLPPVANADHVTAIKDAEVVVRPLANDTDPNGDELRLTSVASDVAGVKVTPDFAAGTFVATATTAGTFYVPYAVTDGPSPAVTGYVRLDVSEPAKATPVATDDLALLPEGGSTVVDVLANDTDPMGGVLVIQRVDVPADVRGLAVEIVDHGLLRVSAPAGLDTPTARVTYTMSNGVGQATGQVLVLPLKATATSQAPVAADDKALVRAGDIVTIPVLANDTSPSGLALSLDPKVTLAGDLAAGDAFAARNAVRFRAKKAGTVRLAYTVVDSAKNYDSAEVVVAVNAADAPNSPPQPKPLVGRVLAGQTVTIPVPTDGVDPDGDSVSLVGIASAPSLGVAVATADGVSYTAPAGASGTDTLTYEVTDGFGAKATSTIQVGVAPANTTNQSPVAVPDDVASRPGRSLNVSPVANDIDPDGDTLALVDEPVVTADDKTQTPAKVSGGLIELTTPNTESTLRYYYGVTDGRGGTAKGVVTVRVSKDAALRYPVALDDTVTPAQIKGQKTVEVDVLANDFDPDGARKDLKLACDEGGATCSNGKVTVPVTDRRQVILYSITDVDGQTSRAAIIVPPAEAVPPYVNPDKIPAKVKAGEVLTLALGEYVVVRQGRTPLLTFENKVKTGPGAEPLNPVKDPQTLQFQTNKEYEGPSSISFEVTDGSNADDPAGLKASLTIPIQVESSGLHQPVFTPSDVSAAAGESAVKVDLRPMVTDRDPGDEAKLAFTKGTVSGEFTVNLNGSTLEVSTSEKTKPGTTGSVAISVTDGSTPAVTGQIVLKATASTRPLMSITTATVPDAKAGVTSKVDLSSYITNPFAAEGKPVTIVGQPTVTAGEGTASVSGLVVSVTPGATFHGTLTVSYTAADATGDPTRQVKGLVNLNVRAKPDAPTGVTAETHLSKTVTVNWTAGANNGAPITKFTVYWSGGSQDCGQATTCTISTLTNNVSYTFTVTATNEVGESDKSAASNAVKPDVKPNPPGTPSGTFGDKQIALTWAAATVPDNGTPVKEYVVEISPAAGTSQKKTTTNSLTWTGLTNGTSYTFRVQANPAEPLPSDWSSYSTAVVPVGVPLGLAAPKVTKNPVSTLAPSGTVTWTAPDGNGDSNLTYEMRRTGTTTVLYSGTSLSSNVTMAVDTANQTFEVRAQNKAGWSNWSSPSNAVRGFKAPGAVTNLSVTAAGQNNQVTISFGPAEPNGAQASEITYWWSVGSASGSLGVSGGTVTNGAFVNGQNVTVGVYAKSTVNGESVSGPSTSKIVNAYGPPVSPSMSCGVGGTAISCSWSGGNANGRNTTFTLSGDASGSVGASGSYNFGDVGYSATRTLCIQALQDGGGSGARNCDAKTTIPPPPPPSVSVAKGTSAQGQPGCSSAGCAYVIATTANFSSSVTCKVTQAGGGTGGFVSWTQGANETKQSPNYNGYPGTLTVQCSNGSQSASGSITW